MRRREDDVQAGREAAEAEAGLVLANDRLLEDDQVAPVAERHARVRRGLHGRAEGDEVGDRGRIERPGGASPRRAGGRADEDGVGRDLAAEERDGLDRGAAFPVAVLEALVLAAVLSEPAETAPSP